MSANCWVGFVGTTNRQDNVAAAAAAFGDLAEAVTSLVQVTNARVQSMTWQSAAAAALRAASTQRLAQGQAVGTELKSLAAVLNLHADWIQHNKLQNAVARQRQADYQANRQAQPDRWVGNETETGNRTVPVDGNGVFQ